MCLFTGSGAGRIPKGLVHNLPVQLFALVTSKMELFEAYFFGIVTTWNDHPKYVQNG